jgi:hypothetical protein
VVKQITITHPFHPDTGKEYDYVCKTKYYGVDYVTCTDEQGKRSMFPVNITNLSTACEELTENGCVMSVENLISLKELMDGITSLQKV